MHFGSIIWSSGRTVGALSPGVIKAKSVRDGSYECSICHIQCTVTTMTPMHSTKLALLTWLTSMYLIAHSSKALSSVVLGRLIGTTQMTA